MPNYLIDGWMCGVGLYASLTACSGCALLYQSLIENHINMKQLNSHKDSHMFIITGGNPIFCCS